jgi:hypothetical protein
MVRMAIQHHFHNGKKDAHPIQLLQTLGRSLKEDPLKATFACSLLFLNPDRDQLSYISCGYSPLFLLSENSRVPRTLTTPNAPLGADPNAPILQTADNWYSGDLLLLHTLGPKPDDPSFLVPHLLLSPQPLAEQTLQLLPHNSKPKLVLALQRLF